MIETYKEVNTTVDANGNERITTKTKTTNIQKNGEPDYVKLYTKMWCQFNEIPERWHNLFFSLIVRMSYANAMDPQNSQVVTVYGYTSDIICKECHWTDKSNLRRGLKVLCDCNAIKRISRATYQINPNYAGRGQWQYNPRLQSGGIEDLIAVFDYKSRSVKTKIIYADDATSQPSDDVQAMYRQMIGKGSTLKETSIIKNNNEEAVS